MNVHLKYCILAACGIAASVLLGLFVDSNAYIVSAICTVWCVYYFVVWLARTPIKPKLTSEEVFRSFHEDDSDQSSTKES